MSPFSCQTIGSVWQKNVRHKNCADWLPRIIFLFPLRLSLAGSIAGCNLNQTS